MEMLCICCSGYEATMPPFQYAKTFQQAVYNGKVLESDISTFIPIELEVRRPDGWTQDLFPDVCAYQIISPDGRNFALCAAFASNRTGLERAICFAAAMIGVAHERGNYHDCHALPFMPIDWQLALGYARYIVRKYVDYPFPDRVIIEDVPIVGSLL
jgi:hypothetical protein